MFGTQQNINQYQKVSIESGVDAANPIELIVMLYDGAILASKSALPYIKNNDYKMKGEFIYKAIRIIQLGLKMSLNYEVGGEITTNLDALYTYMTNLLIKANIENVEQPVHEVVKLLTELRGAWVVISKTDAAKMVSNKKAVAVNDVAYMEKV